MPNVYRAYVPTVDASNFPRIQQANVAALQSSSLGAFPNLCPVQVDPKLVHRKIYAYMFSVSATFTFDYDLVAKLNGMEVYRQKLAQWSNAGNNRWLTSINSQGTNTGVWGEGMIVQVGATACIVAPWRLNITADQFYLAINTVTPAASLFDLGLLVISQAGI